MSKLEWKGGALLAPLPAVIAEESRTHKLCGDKFSRLSA